MGSFSLTNSLSIKISPSVTVSKPAIILSKVDLPQPEGPTITINSPSLMSVDMPWITSVEPKLFLTFLRETVAIFNPNII